MKRSTQVALLLMGVAGVGASAYALSPANRECVQPNAPKPSSAAAVTPGKDPKLEPCATRRSYSSNTGYYRSHWYSSNTTHWSTPIFSRRTTTTTTSTTPSSTSLGFTGPGSSSVNTTRPPGTTTTTTTTTTTRTGFGTIGHSIASHSTSS